MITAEEMLTRVNDYLSAIPYERRPQTLYEPIKYVLSIGGKRIRPVLMLLAYQLYRDDIDTIMPVACGLETYHNYTLLHDDLMDHADLRRGHMTVHKKWDANTAILSGDTMLVLAYQRIAQCAPELLGDIISLFTETALEIGEGQQYDMDFERRNDVTEDEYIEMIRLKTSVLLACALKMGAIQGGATPQDADRLYKAGEKLGIAFQLQDDYLDVYGDPKVFGKAIGGDILQNKKTYMLIKALNHSNPEQRKELDYWLKAEHYERQEKIKAVTRLYDQMGIGQMAQRKIKHFFDESLDALGTVRVSSERMQPLTAYVCHMLNRNS